MTDDKAKIQYTFKGKTYNFTILEKKTEVIGMLQCTYLTGRLENNKDVTFSGKISHYLKKEGSDNVQTK